MLLKVGAAPDGLATSAIVTAGLRRKLGALRVCAGYDRSLTVLYIAFSHAFYLCRQFLSAECSGLKGTRKLRVELRIY